MNSNQIFKKTLSLLVAATFLTFQLISCGRETSLDKRFSVSTNSSKVFQAKLQSLSTINNANISLSTDSSLILQSFSMSTRYLSDFNPLRKPGDPGDPGPGPIDPYPVIIITPHFQPHGAPPYKPPVSTPPKRTPDNTAVVSGEYFGNRVAFIYPDGDRSDPDAPYTGTAVYTSEHIKDELKNDYDFIAHLKSVYSEVDLEAITKEIEDGTGTFMVRVSCPANKDINCRFTSKAQFIEWDKNSKNSRPVFPSQMNSSLNKDDKNPISSSDSVSGIQSTTNYVQGPVSPAIQGDPATNIPDTGVPPVTNDGGAGQPGQDIIDTLNSTLPPGAVIVPQTGPRGLPSKPELNLKYNDQIKDQWNKLKEQTKLWAQGFKNDFDDLTSKANDINSKITSEISSQIQANNALATQVANEITPSAIDTIPDPKASENYLPEDQVEYPGTKFISDTNTKFGQQLQDADRYNRAVRDQVNSSSNTDPQNVKDEKNTLLNFAEVNLNFADSAIVNGNTDDANAYLQAALNLTDVALDFVPVVSEVKAVVSLVTGVDPITGQTLTPLQKTIIAGGLLVPAAISASFNVYEKLSLTIANLASDSQKLSRLTSDSQVLVKNIEKDIEDADKAVAPIAQVNKSDYFGQNLALIEARYGKDLLNQADDLLKDPDMVNTLDKWGKSSVDKGQVNQLIEHLFNPTYKGRWVDLEEEAGLEPGSITNAYTKKDISSIKRGLQTIDELADEIKANPDSLYEKVEPAFTKRNYFKNPSSGNINDGGLRVIETNGKTNTIFPSTYKSFLKQVTKEGATKIK